MQTGTNCPEKPAYDGQIKVFPSPHARGVLLVDVAYLDRYGHLAWAAVPHESSVYTDTVAHYRRIRSLEGKLRKMVTMLLDKAESLLPGALLAPLRAEVDLITINRLLRNLVIQLRHAGLSRGQVWNVIDATSFFEDAVTRRWRYLTDDVRDRYLKWAEEMADAYV